MRIEKIEEFSVGQNVIDFIVTAIFLIIPKN